MTRNAADGSPFRSWRVGDVSITRVNEARIANAPGDTFAGATADHVTRHPWLRPYFVDEQGRLWMSFHSFIIESEGKRIMVDTCVGNDKVRPIPLLHKLSTSYLDDLETAGFAPDSFDFVLCTHLHVDHIGWNTRWTGERWIPTFARARYLFGREEWESFSATHDNSMGDLMGDSIAPVIEAGLCEFVETDHRITGEVRLEPTPGHTPGHVSVRISSRGEEAVITGDLIHHPLQCAEPQLASHFDADPAQARKTREHFLQDCCGRRTMVLGSHFADPTGGWIVRGDTQWRFAVEPPHHDEAAPVTDPTTAQA